MKLRPIAAIVLRQYYLLRGSPIRAVPTFAWVAIDIVLWGFISRYLNSVGGHGIDFVPQLLGAVLFWDFFTRIMQGVTIAFLEDVWSRNFLNLFATPLLISEYVTGLMLTSVLTSVFAVVVMTVLATLVFHLPLLALGRVIAPALLVLFLFGLALGVLASAMVLRFGPASEWLAWPIPALIAPFCGVFYPVATLPGWMQAFASALPPSYVFEALRAVAAGGAAAPGPLLSAGALALVQAFIAVLAFAGVFRRVVRSGLLARYSAESVS
jgi:ABC-2 type transport system permease protein